MTLADEVTVTRAETLTSDLPFSDDLCLKAARVLREATGAKAQGAAIRVVKRIPVGGGLGGGSADAAATLHALNELWRLNLTDDELAALGARVGSDVAALVLGGPVLMEGRGETVTRLPPLARPLHLVVASSLDPCCTKEVYAHCRARAATAPSATAAMIAALRAGDCEAIVAALANDLQTAALDRYPQIAVTRDALLAVGARAVLLSGSGSSFFALAASAAEAEAIARGVRDRGLSAWAVESL